MDTNRFDRLTRALALALSRRGIAGALALTAIAVPSRADARKRRKKRKKHKKRHKKRPRPCVAEPVAETCARAGCGAAQQNNCGQAVACPCPTGRTCLLNGTCAQPCTKASECTTCFAGCSNLTTENQQHCLQVNVPGLCDNAQACDSTSACPREMQCQECPFMSGQHRCLAVCPE